MRHSSSALLGIFFRFWQAYLWGHLRHVRHHNQKVTRMPKENVHMSWLTCIPNMNNGIEGHPTLRRCCLWYLYCCFNTCCDITAGYYDYNYRHTFTLADPYSTRTPLRTTISIAVMKYLSATASNSFFDFFFTGVTNSVHSFMSTGCSNHALFMETR